MNPLTYPTLHDNGTRPSRLVETYHLAYHALEDARYRLRATAPNARDYGPDDLPKAEAEHASRLGRLDSIMAELDALIGHCREAEGR